MTGIPHNKYPRAVNLKTKAWLLEQMAEEEERFELEKNDGTSFESEHERGRIDCAHELMSMIVGWESEAEL